MINFRLRRNFRISVNSGLLLLMVWQMYRVLFLVDVKILEV